MSGPITRHVLLRQARLTNRNLVATVLETVGLALLLCVPIVWWFMPLVLVFNPMPYVFWLGAAGPLLLLFGILVRPRILRPDFVNSIMLYQEDQS